MPLRPFTLSLARPMPLLLVVASNAAALAAQPAGPQSAAPADFYARQLKVAVVAGVAESSGWSR